MNSSWWMQLVIVMAGGSLGAAGRFWLSSSLGQTDRGMPWATLLVNLLGSFLVGMLWAYLQKLGDQAIYWRAFLLVGLLGGLTTYSALMLECLLISRGGKTALMMAYLMTTLVGGLMLVALGARVGAYLRYMT
jgi:CrcB protein